MRSPQCTFATPAPISAVLDVPAGRIQIIATDRTATTVEIRPADAGKSRDAKAVEGTTVEYRDGVLRVSAPAAKNQILGPSGTLEATLQVPAGSRIEVKAGGAEVRGVGRLGEVTVDGAYGTVKFDEAAGARITAHGGDVTVGRLTGPAQISTGTGTIHITDATTGALVLRTAMGDITVGTAAGVSATLDASTGYGRVHNALRNTEGTTAGLTIRATTDRGDITARGR
ncbi:DUF4097 family beta strand repeat-containing protein [Micromonospora sp. CPCC 205561]|uniref:DUF4097 family beta strand repeat-containing protein n=1 Tax=Micromonospora sp. CPCC 205561 TaxID=3122407 RepID=UPI002FF29194